MPFSVNGTFTIINSFTPNTPILSADTNENNDDIADGLTELWSRDVAWNVNLQVFTSSGTYIPTSGLLNAVIECVGGGAGGQGTATAPAGQLSTGGGGGGGQYCRSIVTPGDVGASKVVTIGSAGTGGAAGATLGTNGGTTSVGTLCIAGGGLAGGGGGSGGSGDITIVGGAGFSPGLITANTSTLGFGGGGNAGCGYGAGAAGLNVIVSTTGNTGGSYGGGGGGGAAFNGSGAAAGGPGASGLVIVTEYIGPA